jgi:hypothetical protein
VKHASRREQNSQRKLHIQIGLDSSTGLVILATFMPKVSPNSLLARERAMRTSNKFDIKRRVYGVRDLICIETLQIRKARKFIQIASERDRILFRTLWDVMNGVIELFETFNGNRSFAARIDSHTGAWNSDFVTSCERMGVTWSPGKAECRPTTFGTMECRCWLDEFDVFIKVHWQAIFGRAHEDITVLIMLPHAEFLK